MLSTFFYLRSYHTSDIFIVYTCKNGRKMSSEKKGDAQNPGFLRALVQPFVIGSLSGCIATSVIQPIDTVKVNIQSRKEAARRTKVNLNPIHIFKEILEKYGVKGLYQGLDSALMRQVVYCGIRLGLFRVFEEQIQRKHNRKMTFGEKVGYSMFAGLVGSGIANPFDMALIRFQSDNSLPDNEKRNYKNVFDAMKKMTKQMGFLGLWTGAVPTIVRAMFMNMFMLVSYNEAKEQLMKYYNEKKQTTEIRIIGSAISGISAVLGSLPFDNVKTKILKMRKDEHGQYPYKGFIDCFAQSIKNEGFFSLWVGLPTYYVRVAPHAIISILAQDYLHDLLDKKKNKKQ